MKEILLQHQCVSVGFALLKDPGSSETAEPEGLNSPIDTGSPKHHFQGGTKEEQVSWRTLSYVVFYSLNLELMQMTIIQNSLSTNYLKNETGLTTTQIFAVYVKLFSFSKKCF